MKTLTEFSPLTLRKAAAARAALGGAPRAEASEPIGEVAEPTSEPDNVEASESAEPMDASSDGGETAAESEAAATPDDPQAAAIADAVGVPADRGQRLIEALD